MKSDYQNRLNQFLTETGETASSLEDKCSLGRSTISRIMQGDGDRKLSSKTLDNIVKIYPWLSIEWLQTGRGKMRMSALTEFSEIEKSSFVQSIIKEKDELQAKYYSLLEKYNACLEGRISGIISRR